MPVVEIVACKPPFGAALFTFLQRANNTRTGHRSARRDGGLSGADKRASRPDFVNRPSRGKQSLHDGGERLGRRPVFTQHGLSQGLDRPEHELKHGNRTPRHWPRMHPPVSAALGSCCASSLAAQREPGLAIATRTRSIGVRCKP